ncbi:Txe/YoeB family addiction module toxin [Sulfurimonas sp. SAG-AH-194-I05]|nr:Txe/YoeB family addiction module toxin [Sulfurimonas sp. SAG-AH-194-I05]MDF1876049.1 Txe/YoeB family addiction module toxin [Sulfurimonas sp. SAG-AH-194-I05]
MILGFSTKGWEDYTYWQYNDKKILKRINQLIKEIQRDPLSTSGLGKPERLKENFHGYYSRRITSEHRLVYKVADDLIIVAQCRFHY